MEHPSEAVEVEKFFVYLFLLPCFRLPHASSKDVSYGLLTGVIRMVSDKPSLHSMSEATGTDMASVVVTVDEDYDLMHGLEV